MTAYYNEHEPYAAQWLRNLIAAGHIAAGDVDARDIQDVTPDDLTGYTQCHFFAGLGGWSYALRLAGWPDDRPVWTGSCPCQPFSAAGKRSGTDDARHLWPEWFRLIDVCRPPIIFGEQVSGVGGRAWLSGADQNLQRLWDRETVLRVLSEEGWMSTRHLQDVHDRARAAAPDEEARRQKSTARERAIVETTAAWACPLCRCKTASQEQGLGILVRLGRHSETSGSRRLRTDGYPVQLGRLSVVGRPIARPDRAVEGVHECQCACGAPLHQRDGERVGCAEDRRDGEGDLDSQESLERELAALLDGGTEGTDLDTRVAGVRTCLARAGYAVGGADLPAASVGAPHIRQRLWWVAHATGHGHARTNELQVRREEDTEQQDVGHRLADADVAQSGHGGLQQSGRLMQLAEDEAAVDKLADAECAEWGPVDHARRDERLNGISPREEGAGRTRSRGEDGGLGDAALLGRVEERADAGRCRERDATKGPQQQAWDDSRLIPCADGKARRIPESDIFPLAHRVHGRLGKLRAYGNVICPQVAAVFIRAAREAVT